MIPGIEILNVIVETSSAFGWSSAGFLLLLVAFMFAFFGFIAFAEMSEEVMIPCGIIAAIALFASLMCFCTAQTIYTYSYEVCVEDTVEMNEFLERYEILEHRDKIYLIQEIDEEAQHINRAEE